MSEITAWKLFSKISKIKVEMSMPEFGKITEISSHVTRKACDEMFTYWIHSVSAATTN